MESVTDNPVPEPGALEKFLEQVGIWLDAFPTVPPWMEWIAILVGIGGPVMSFLWVRWGANWWAVRSKNAAERRARKLLKRVAEVHALSRNRPAMLFNGVNVLIALGFASLFAVLGNIELGGIFGPNALGQPPSDFLVSGRKFAGVLLLAVAIVMMFIFLTMFGHIKPLANIDRYTERSRTRIEKLLAKAGVPDEVAVEFLRIFDARVDAARNQEIR